ncbi:MAG TPA: hypothetical protein VGG72_23700 [Bryobacteraceae bacterium]|jgi:hypothetical protein
MLRVRSASSYQDESLPASIRDNELRFDQTIGPIRFTKLESDYYLSSYSARFESRAFDDFDADACLIIRDPNSFGARIVKAFEAVMPGWENTFGAASYVDPLRAPLCDDIRFAKHFRYAYQAEARFVWTPLKPVARLQHHVELELGDLSSFCELIAL